MIKRRKVVNKLRQMPPWSGQERGNLWIPLNSILVDKDPFEKKFKMTKSDKLFKEMEYRFRKSSHKRLCAESAVAFLSPFKEFHERGRARYCGVGTINRPYPSGSCQMSFQGNIKLIL